MSKFNDELQVYLYDMIWLAKDHEKEITALEKENEELNRELTKIKNFISSGRQLSNSFSFMNQIKKLGEKI